MVLQMDTFMIEAVDLDSLTKIKVYHVGSEAEDNTGICLKKVIIKDPTDDKKRFLFECEDRYAHLKDSFMLYTVHEVYSTCI